MGSAFRSSSIQNFATRTNTTFTAPSGIADGDILIIHFCIGANGTTPPVPTTPTGFSVTSGSFPITATSAAPYTIKNYSYYKVASSESGNYTVTHTSSDSFGYMCAVSGGAAGAPGVTTNTGTGTTTTALAVTPTNNNSFVMIASMDWNDTNNTLSAPTGTTPTFNIRCNFAQCSNLFVADGVLATAASTGNKTMTNNTVSIDPWAGFLYKVEAAGAVTLGSMMGLLGVGP
jgi:hypothetical protein